MGMCAHLAYWQYIVSTVYIRVVQGSHYFVLILYLFSDLLYYLFNNGEENKMCWRLYLLAHLFVSLMPCLLSKIETQFEKKHAQTSSACFALLNLISPPSFSLLILTLGLFFIFTSFTLAMPLKNSCKKSEGAKSKCGCKKLSGPSSAKA